MHNYGIFCFCDNLDGIRIKYSDIPHLAMPVIIDKTYFEPAVIWLTDEMERRYKKLNKYGAVELSELNDPMEGYIDVYFQGDLVIWKNLLKTMFSTMAKEFVMFLLLVLKKFKRPIPVLLSFTEVEICGRYL